MTDGIARVEVLLKTKHLNVTTPVKNLLNLDHVPACKRVFYYGPQVEALNDDTLIAEDLVLYVEKPAPLVGS